MRERETKGSGEMTIIAKTKDDGAIVLMSKVELFRVSGKDSFSPGEDISISDFWYTLQSVQEHGSEIKKHAKLLKEMATKMEKAADEFAKTV